jgi:hypothetical protein
MANVYYGTGCPEEIRELFETLGVEHEYEASKFRNLDRTIRSPWGKRKYWNRRAYDILFNYAYTNIGRYIEAEEEE